MKYLGIGILIIIGIIILISFIKCLFSNKRTWFNNLFTILFAVAMGFVLVIYLFVPDMFWFYWDWYNNIFHIV